MSRTPNIFLASPVFAAVLSVVACSATAARNGFTSASGTNSTSTSVGTASGGGGESGISVGAGLGGGIIIGDGGNSDAPTGQCTGLQCQAQTDNCSGQGKSETTISGTVYDPAGKNPLYNVYVYIPNSKPDAIVTGHPTCTQCEAPASGDPVIGALTDANGNFTLTKSSTDTWGVPSGRDLPIVLQAGKWRRQMTIPITVEACTANAIPNPSTASERLRLPAQTSEGDMPLIAFTSGCDPAECFLRNIGIADSEFVPPGSAQGHVHFYTGQDADNGNGTDASMVSGGNTSADTYQWWTSAANLEKYDIVFNACECNPNDRGAGSYAAMESYLNSGGRLFTTHYYYNWFAPKTGPADFQGVVQWVPGSGGQTCSRNSDCMTGYCETIGGGFGVCTCPSPNDDSSSPYCNYYIDQSFPKGMAFAQWLQNIGATQTLGQISLTDTRWDMNLVNSPTTDWIYSAPSSGFANYASMYMSFNAPVGAATTSQCGRAVFSDVHLSGTSDDSVFPGECSNPDPGGAHANNEKALEFLFFDLSSCIQNDTMPPPPPPPVNN